MPSLVQAPRDLERYVRRQPARPTFFVEPEVLLSPHIAGHPIASELGYSEEYRQELSRAFSEVFLLRDGAAVNSIMFHRPLRAFRDPARVQRAQRACHNQDPVQLHLNPLLQMIGQPPI
jgi:hypothetical protein